MSKLILTAEFIKELETTKDRDPLAFEAAVVLLEELRGNPDLLCSTPFQYFEYQPMFEVKRFVEAHKRNCFILIVKFHDFLDVVTPFRILIGYHKHDDDYYALAYPPRGWNYDASDERFAVLLHRYVDNGLPFIRS